MLEKGDFRESTHAKSEIKKEYGVRADLACVFA